MTKNTMIDVPAREYDTRETAVEQAVEEINQDAHERSDEYTQHVVVPEGGE